jgi:hypothetical protein
MASLTVYDQRFEILFHTDTGVWHDLVLQVNGTSVQGALDGKMLLQQDLPEPVSGKVGLWSKADSVVYFDDFIVQPAG